MPPRRKPAAAAASPAARKSPRAAVQVAASPASTRVARSRSTSTSSKGEKTSPVPSPAPSSRSGRSGSRSGKAAEPVEEVEAVEDLPAPRGRSARRGAPTKEEVATPSPRGSGRLTRAVVQDEQVKRSGGKAAKPQKGGRGRSRGRGKKQEQEEEEEEEEEVEEKVDVPEEDEVEEEPPEEKTPPAKKTPARSGRSRGRQAKAEPEPEPEEEAEAESQTTEKGDSQESRGRRSSRGRATETKTPPKKATPKGRRGQSKQESPPDKMDKEEPASEAEEEAAEAEPEAKPETTPRSRSRRAAKSPAAKTTPTPPSRSRRGRGKPEPEAAEDKADTTEVSEDKADEEAMAEPEKAEESAALAEPEKAGESAAPVEEPAAKAEVDESTPSGMETPPEEAAPPADPAPPAEVAPSEEAAAPAEKSSDDRPDEQDMEVEEIDADATPSSVPLAAQAVEPSQPETMSEAAIEPEVAAAPVTCEEVEELSPPADQAESAPVENAALESAEAAVPELPTPEKEPSAAPYSPEVVTLSPDVPDQNVESLSSPPKSPEIISISPPTELEDEVSEMSPAVIPSSDEPEIISISPPPELAEAANSEPEVLTVPEETHNSVSAEEVISLPSDEPITIEDEPVLQSRKRSHEEVEEAADDEDLSSKKAKVITLSEQDDAFDGITQVTLANGSQESPAKEKPVTKEVEPDIVETEVEPMEVGHASGEGDFTAAPSEVPVEPVSTAPESKNTCNSASSNDEDILKEYVVIEMSDVPGATTGQVQEAANKAQPAAESPANHVSQTVPSEKDPLLNRLFVANPNLPSDSIAREKQFTVVSYNILAECWMRHYSEAYTYATPKLFETSYRHSRIMEELRYLDADVVCLQEVEGPYFENTLQPALTSLGYGGVFKSRLADEKFKEGEAIFYKHSRFTLTQSEGKFLKELAEKEIESSALSEEIRECVRKYLDMPDVVLVANLQCKQSGNTVTVGTVHVNYAKFEKPNAQCIQISCAIKELVSRANNGNTPHIICGDFNSPPDSPGYQLARDGYLSDDMIQVLQSSNNLLMPDGSKNALVNHLWRGFQHTSSTMKSAYATVQEVEPGITTLVGTVFKHCLDYIFYSSGSLDTVGVLQVASEADITANVGLPSAIFPSDHLSMKAVFGFK